MSRAALPAVSDSDGESTLTEIVVTGTTAKDRTILNSSSDIIAIDEAALAQKATRSTDEVLELIPGMRIIAEEFTSDRDFLVLHYHSTRGRSEPLWEYYPAMALPEGLISKEPHFARSGRIILSTDELFREAGWFAVLLGRGHRPSDYNPLIDSIKSADNFAHLGRIREEIRSAAKHMPDQLAYFS